MLIKKVGKTSFVGAKVDMSKVYNPVECEYNEGILGTVGFSPRWVQLIMGCVFSVSYNLCINGNLCGEFKSGRELRQGDPFSLFLFLLCTKGLSRFLHKMERVGKIRGFKVARQVILITHLFFFFFLQSIVCFFFFSGPMKVII